MGNRQGFQDGRQERHGRIFVIAAALWGCERVSTVALLWLLAMKAAK
jgi:hypothetical protein